ncbi:hypothetical protein KIH31_14835 [Paenarthrobacter sp. DKR-5]|uniref:N,N-dimethylformamidase beta subunit family domain-containing protein n=1 Tax=Paenarthrobacter sp. DKR-5 TaxID=2835535 RepID=UPI001BDD3E87|nr:N,N-dimethylformamidase beta subunit family domain-containing protein [Paenarthrobacter sp. DKR-5]MBT1003872.1 hypothetical protein [Paenarthrobacter sp. DKR-5]
MSSQSPGFSRRALMVAALAGTTAALTATSPAGALTNGFTFQGENRLRGTPRGQLPTWWGTSGALEGFLGQHASTAQRRVIDLYVSSTQKTFQVHAYRLGHYAGLGQRLVWSSPVTPARVQAPAAVHPVTRTVSCDWKISLRVDTSAWPEGFYYLVLSAPGAQAHLIPLVVESASLAGKAVVVFNDLTMQAYNHWGGASLYTGVAGSAARRSLKVSFDRPYGNPAVFEIYNAPLIRTAETITDGRVSLGYTTEARLAGSPALLVGSAALLFSGHSEYWTAGMRRSVETARDTGTNVVFFGANNVYWRARTEPTALGSDRLVVCYRNPVLDPLASAHPELATTRWRDAPHPEPECSLTGSMYGDLGAQGTFTVTDPGFFAFQGTGVRRGTVFPGLVAGETDADSRSVSQPRNLLIFSHSPSQGVYRARGWSDGSIYTVKSGAAVINLASTNWLPAQQDPAVPARSRAFAAQVTRNIITATAQGPLARRYRWPAV